MTDDRYPSDTHGQVGGSETTLREVWGIVRRSRWLVLGITAATLALAAVLTVVLPPSYEGQASVRIVTASPGGGLMGEVGELAGLGLAPDEVDTEVGVIQSRRIAHTVAESLALHVTLLEPRARRDSVLRVIRAPQDAPDGVFRLSRRADGSYAFAVEREGRHGAPAALPQGVRPGVPFRVGSAELALAPGAPEEVRFSVQPFRQAMRKVDKNLVVDRQEKSSQIIEIVYTDRDPGLAAAFPNAVMQAFVDYKDATSTNESRRMAAALRGQVDVYRDQLRTAEERLRAFREQQQVVNPEAQSSEQVRRLARFQAENDAAGIERQALASLLAEIRRNQGETPSPARRLGTFPSFVAYGAVQNLLGTLTGLESQRATQMVGRSAEHPEVAQITRRIAELEAQLAETGENYLANLDRKIASTTQTLQRFDGEVARIPAQEAEFGRLLREQEMLSEVYVLLQTKLKEAEVTELANPGEVRVLDTAFVPDEPEYPKPLLNLALALVTGLLLGLVVATGREVMNTTVRSRADAETASGGLPVLGTIPRIGGVNAERRSLRRRRTDVVPAEGLVTRRSPGDPAAEAYRTLRVGIASTGADAPRVIVLTSAVPGDGKSTSAANLAVALAQQGTRTLLVDADLRRGRLHEAFGVPGEGGLAQVLLGKATLADAVRPVETDSAGAGSLHLLPAGQATIGAADLLGSARMLSLMGELREQFDTVIFDAPALSAGADAAILGRAADVTLLVARNGSTEKSALQDAVTRLRSLHAPLGGVVITDFAETATPASGWNGWGADRNN